MKREKWKLKKGNANWKGKKNKVKKWKNEIIEKRKS